MTNPTPDPTPCPDCSQPTHIAVTTDRRTGDERTVRLTVDRKLLGIWVITEPGRARTATSREIQSDPRRTGHSLHTCTPPDLAKPEQPALF